MTCLLPSGCLLLATGIQPLIYILVFQISIIKNSYGKKPVASDQKPVASSQLPAAILASPAHPLQELPDRFRIPVR
jgi:hypothetical protein